MTKKQNYLRNRDLMKNIHLSKATYTWYIDGNHKTTNYLYYDLIACDEAMYEQTKNQLMLQTINSKRIKNGNKRTSILKDEHIDMLEQEDFDLIEDRIYLFDGEFTEELIKAAKLGHHNRKLYENGNKRLSELPQEIEDEIDLEDLVIRVFTYDHIPDLPEDEISKRNKVADLKQKVNFPPYKHYAIIDGDITCVAISHYNKNKDFSIGHGYITPDLATSFIKLCQRIAQRSNWRGYSYCEDMQGQALVQLSSVGLQFNEMFSNNPFSYYTSVINNAFTVIFNQEKDVQVFRDKLLIENDHNPSWTAQLDSELARNEHWDDITGNNNTKAGRVDNIDIDSYNSMDEEE